MVLSFVWVSLFLVSLVFGALFGTADAVVVGSGHLWITDLKYGTGVEVLAENNPQASCVFCSRSPVRWFSTALFWRSWTRQG